MKTEIKFYINPKGTEYPKGTPKPTEKPKETPIKKMRKNKYE